MPERYDILIAGAGFAGSLTALVLHQRGFSVCLVEKGQHPRFAIGESSTPVADLLLRDLSVRYDLPWLYAFSRYGSWQEAHPEIGCGIKRGFSYFKHYPGREFTTDAAHSQELLVAASASDKLSDTHWLRADFDAFLVERVKEAGIVYLDNTDIVAASRDGDLWSFGASRVDGADRGGAFVKVEDPLLLEARFFIDGTGGGGLLGKLLGVESSAEGFETNSYGLFSHFDDVPRWSDWLRSAGFSTDDFPYDPDHSALHQVLDEGWIWMLRFNDRRISVGFALDGRKAPTGGLSPEEQWAGLLGKYPSVGALLEGAAFSRVPGKLIRSGRLQRRAAVCSGPGWAALPHSVGFVDPLFSPGIAHSITGVRRLAGVLEAHWDDFNALSRALGEYGKAVVAELSMIDVLVAGCYATMPHFELFRTWSMVYFAATIASEQRLLAGERDGYFLGADREEVIAMVRDCRAGLMPLVGGPAPSAVAVGRFVELVREKIEPFNIAGLMDPAVRNMYRHTVAVL